MIRSRFTFLASALAAFALPASAQYVVADHDFNTSGLLGVDDAEFTPDGRYIIARDNALNTLAQVFDGHTGAQLAHFTGSGTSGPCEDAVVCTNDYAVVLGFNATFIDLNNLAGGPYAVHNVVRGRDVALTPDGRTVAVRGELKMFLFDLASGTLVAERDGLAPPYSSTAFEVDSVVATDEHAVFTSITGVGNTRVTIWDLHPAGGGGPVVAFETTVGVHQKGRPHDLTLTPDGKYAAVRSYQEVGLYRLDGAQSQQVWSLPAANGFPDAFGGSAMDSIVATDTMVASISRRVIGSIGAYLDVFEIPTGANHYEFLEGDPHDLALTPDGERLVIRTHKKLFLFDVGTLPGGPLMQALDELLFFGNFTSWSSGLDSLSVTNDRVLAVSRLDNSTKVRVFDIGADSFDKVFGTKMPEPPTDVLITPGETYGLVTGETAALVIDLRLNTAVLEHDPFPGGTTPWCDGVAATDDKVAFFGAVCCDDVASGGWLTVVDLFSRADNYCPTNPNSTGEHGRMVATGSSRVSDNDLKVTAFNLPVGEAGQFIYGAAQQHIPVGDGFLCVMGQLARFPVQVAGPAGRVVLPIDSSGLPPGGGALLPGTTWNFQFVHRDTNSATGNMNLTDAVSVLFE